MVLRFVNMYVQMKFLYRNDNASGLCVNDAQLV